VLAYMNTDRLPDKISTLPLFKESVFVNMVLEITPVLSLFAARNKSLYPFIFWLSGCTYWLCTHQEDYITI
jgi:hypothetical protein